MYRRTICDSRMKAFFNGSGRLHLPAAAFQDCAASAKAVSRLSLFLFPTRRAGTPASAESRAFKDSPVQDQSEHNDCQEEPVPVIAAHMKGDAEQAQGINGKEPFLHGIYLLQIVISRIDRAGNKDQKILLAEQINRFGQSQTAGDKKKSIHPKLLCKTSRAPEHV